MRSRRRLATLAGALAALMVWSGCTGAGDGQPSGGPAATSTAGATALTPSQRRAPSGRPVPTATYTSLTSPDRVLLPIPAVKPAGFVDPPPGEGLQRYFTQTVVWSNCDQGFECASVAAPLDWADPDGQAITLKMKRRPASSTEVSLGHLFLNPGGPGASAQDYVTRFDPAGLERYSLIAVDPRGSGESTPVQCGTPKQTDAYFNLDYSPDSSAEHDALIQGSKRLAAECRQASGPLLDHISSIETVYDFDMVRQLLQEPRLNYLGVSYGTYLGALHAELFPATTGLMILDAAVNITDNESISQSQGFELALRNYATWCVSKRCGVATSEQAVIDRIGTLLEQLDSRPMKVGDRTLTQSLALTGLAFYFYSGADGYQTVTNVLLWALQEGEGRYLLLGADLMNDRMEDGSYGSIAYSFPAISCVDGSDRGIDEAFVKWNRDAEIAPVFGRFSGPDSLCPVWSTRPAAHVDFSGKGAPALLVIGGTGDNATPYQYSEWMAAELESAVLVTREGAGHGSYSSDNVCVGLIVRNYLVNGVVPADGTRCEA